MKNSAVVRFHAETYKEPKKLLKHFKKTIHGIPDFFFKMAEINGMSKNDVCLTLYSINGFIIQVVGLKPGTESSGLLIELLKFCGFAVDDETSLNILHHQDIQIVLWNESLKKS